jgi:hypothetical protein
VVDLAPLMTSCLILLLLISQSVLSVDSIVVEAQLRDGAKLSGTIDDASFKFSGVAVSGDLVQLEILKPPEWSNLKWVCQIDWDGDRQVFVIRNFSWTGELRQIWDRLLVTTQSGELSVLKGHELQTARFGYFESEQESR